MGSDLSDRGFAATRGWRSIVNISSGSTRLVSRIEASREKVYATLVDPVAVELWMSPVNMIAKIHEFDARVGGAIRVSLTHLDPTRPEKRKIAASLTSR